MPISASDLAMIGKYSLDDFLKNNPIDQVNKDRPLMSLLMANKKLAGGGKQYIVEQVRVKYDSNFQWFYGDDTVTYNRRDTIEQSEFDRGACHDGFSLHEDDFINNGLELSDGKTTPMTNNEKAQLTDLFQENMTALKIGMEEALDYQMHLDGTQDANAVAGLDHLVSLDGTGTVGGIDASANPYWQNNFATGVASGAITETLEKQLRACKKFRGNPKKIICGEEFYDAYRVEAKTDVINHHSTGGNARSIDAGVTGLSFHNIPLEIDYTFNDLDDALSPAIPWAKRAYMLDTATIKYRPIRGQDMKTRNPDRDKDNYVWYWAVTHRFSLTINKRRANSVIAIS